jgi:hypothetical protein
MTFTDSEQKEFFAFQKNRKNYVEPFMKREIPNMKKTPGAKRAIRVEISGDREGLRQAKVAKTTPSPDVEIQQQPKQQADISVKVGATPSAEPPAVKSRSPSEDRRVISTSTKTQETTQERADQRPQRKFDAIGEVSDTSHESSDSDSEDTVSLHAKDTEEYEVEEVAEAPHTSLRTRKGKSQNF